MGALMNHIIYKTSKICWFSIEVRTVQPIDTKPYVNPFHFPGQVIVKILLKSVQTKIWIKGNDYNIVNRSIAIFLIF